MSVRINQELIQVVTPGVGNTRINQVALLLITPTALKGQRVQIVGGPFVDALGNPLSNGYLIMQLQHDAVAIGADQIVGAVSVRVPLDINGNIQGTTTGNPVFIWPNDVLTPAGGTYIVWAYDSANRPAFNNPQIQQVLSNPNPFNVNAWIPGP